MLKQSIKPKIYLLFSIFFILFGGILFWFSFEDEKAMAQPAATNYSETWQVIGANPAGGCNYAGGTSGPSAAATPGIGCSYPAGWLVNGNIGGTSYGEIWQAQGTAVCTAQGGSYPSGWWGENCGFPRQWSVKGSISGSPYTLTTIKTAGGGGMVESAKHWLIRQYGLYKRVGIGRCDDQTSVSQWDIAWYSYNTVADGNYVKQSPDYRYYNAVTGSYSSAISEAPLCYSYMVGGICQIFNCYSNAVGGYVIAAQFCATYPPIIWDNRAAYQNQVPPPPLCTKVELYQPTP